jgi:hypothetical protein
MNECPNTLFAFIHIKSVVEDAEEGLDEEESDDYGAIDSVGVGINL